MSNKFHIDLVSAQNWMGLKDKAFQMKGESVFFIANNDRGKSTFLQIIEFCYVRDTKRLPPKVVNTNEREAEGTIVLKDEAGRQYKLKATASKSRRGADKVRVELLTSLGVNYDKKKDIDRVLGEPLIFDPVKFIDNSSTGDGLVRNEKMVWEPLFSIDLEALRKRQKELKSDLNANRKELKSLMEGIKIHNLTLSDLEGEYELKDIDKLYEKAMWAQNRDAELTALQQKVQAAQKEVESYEERLKAEAARYKNKVESVKEQLNKKIKELQEKVKRLDNGQQIPETQDEYNAMEIAHADLSTRLDHAKAEAKEAATELSEAQTFEGDPDEINREYEEALEYNNRVGIIHKLQGHGERIKELEELNVDLEGKIDKIIETRKKKVIEPSKGVLPDPFHIDFNEQGKIQIFYTDDAGASLPINHKQIASSRKILLAWVVGSAIIKQCRLKVMCIADGNLLDKTTMERILKEADKQGIQVFIELVDSGANTDVVEMEYTADIELRTPFTKKNKLNEQI